MHSHFAHRRLVAASRGGFTLVEMMVATTLVVLMMLMFAQIYIAAVSSLGDQQAIARNDAKSRLADMLLRGDLRRGSYRAVTGSQNGIYPLVRYETPSIYQRGYFYLSENSEANPLDDVLQFTTFVSRYSRNRDPSPYYGRAALVTLGGAPVLGYHPNPVVTSPQRFFSNHRTLMIRSGWSRLQSRCGSGLLCPQRQPVSSQPVDPRPGSGGECGLQLGPAFSRGCRDRVLRSNYACCRYGSQLLQIV